MKTAPVTKDGVAPDNFHSTSIYPEYFKIGGRWKIAEDSRMDCSVVIRPDGKLEVLEYRKLREGDVIYEILGVGGDVKAADYEALMKSYAGSLLSKLFTMEFVD